MTLTADVVIVGTGAGAAPVALTLARAGVDVLMLDRGPRHRRQDFHYDELGVARRDFFVPSARTDPHIVMNDDGSVERSNDGWIALCVGGGTVHWSGFAYRFRPEDFQLRTLLGGLGTATHADWPISYDDLEPFYAMVDAEIGVSGSAAEEGKHVGRRSSDYPLPKVANHSSARLIDEAAKRLGRDTFPTPRAILSQSYQGRNACDYHDVCGSFGCTTGAKGSTMETLLPKAEKTGKCRIIPDARVHQIEMKTSTSARGVVFRDAEGRDQRVEARTVVVAASAVESVRLLLMSQGPGHARGLGNNGGQLGQNFMFSTLSKAHGSFDFTKKASFRETFAPGPPFFGRSSASHYMAEGSRGLGKGGGLNFLFPAGGPIFQSELLASRGDGLILGRELKEKLHHYWFDQRQLDCETFGEYLPNPGTRVELDPSVEDAWGFPVARIYLQRHAHDLAVSQYLGERAAEYIDAAGAQDVWMTDVGGSTRHLPMGGCRMGSAPESSYLRKDCRVHDVDNVYVSDGSVFPSSGGWPPTMTIMANAFRVGRGILDALVAKDL